MRNVAVVGAGMTRFGKYLDRGLKELAREAVEGALESAGVDKSALQVAVVGNAAAGLVTGQEMVRAQVMLREMGLGGIPMVNTENACASSSTAFHLAWLYIASGMYDVALALGVEKLYHEDKKRSFAAIGAAVDVEIMQKIVAAASADRKPAGDGKEGGAAGAGESRSLFMDLYAALARDHMRRYGTTKEQYARVAEKNHFNGSLNPHAQYRERYTVEEILASPPVAEPLTRLMCSPIGDGAAGIVLCSEEKARQLTTKPLWVRASVLTTGQDHGPDDPGIGDRAAAAAYEMAGLGPNDISMAEVHDATAPAELFLYEEMGFCRRGEGGRFIDSGDASLGGKLPVNTSGGLISKGHPIGATGTAQIYEVFLQLREEAGERQVKGAKVGLTENGGGMIRGENAVASVHILSV